MSDSVRQQAARILANPTTVEEEVRETIAQLRIRYQQLQDRVQSQSQSHAHTATQSVAAAATTTSAIVIENRFKNDQLHSNKSHRDERRQERSSMQQRDGDNVSSPNGSFRQHPQNNDTTTTTRNSNLGSVLHVQHDDDELIALHVLRI
jgi:hypothetical protein